MRQLHRASDADLSGIGLLPAEDHAKQRRFAGAVRADDADDRPRRDLQRELVDQQALAVALGDALQLDHLVAQALGDRDEDLLRLVALLMLLRRQLLESGQSRL